MAIMLPPQFPWPGELIRHSFHLGLFRVASVDYAAGTMEVIEVEDNALEPHTPKLCAWPRAERIDDCWRHATC